MHDQNSPFPNDPFAPDEQENASEAEPSADAGGEGGAPEPAAADAKIAALEAEVASLKDQLLRALAEAENSRKRARREAEETAKYAVSNFAKELLSASDNLHRALENIPPEGRQSDELLERLATGVELVERDLKTILEKHGIKRIEALGQPFDPNLHQAVYEIPTAEHAPGTVVQVMAPGYLIHDRLLRPAMVAVAKRPGA